MPQLVSACSGAHTLGKCLPPLQLPVQLPHGRPLLLSRRWYLSHLVSLPMTVCVHAAGSATHRASAGEPCSGTFQLAELTPKAPWCCAAGGAAGASRKRGSGRTWGCSRALQGVLPAACMANCWQLWRGSAACCKTPLGVCRNSGLVRPSQSALEPRQCLGPQLLGPAKLKAGCKLTPHPHQANDCLEVGRRPLQQQRQLQQLPSRLLPLLLWLTLLLQSLCSSLPLLWSGGLLFSLKVWPGSGGHAAKVRGN